MVSVIIVNYNGIDVIQDCLHSLDKQTFKDFEVIVVDNSSTDGSLEYLNKYLSCNSPPRRARIIPLSKNIGFAGGNLQGLRHAKGEFAALLNNDTEPDAGWLEGLVNEMDNNPEIGICASKLILYQSEIIDSAGDGYSRALRGFKRGEGGNKNTYSNKEFVFGACAGAAMYRRKMLDEIGSFDENFFLIYEDADLNFRAQLAGWKALYVPAAIVHHKVRSSIGNMSDMAIYYSLRNSELVRIKDIPAGIFFRCLPEYIISALAEFVYFAIKHRKISLYFKAKCDALRMFPLMLNKRKAIMKAKKAGNEYLLGMMTPVWQKDFFKAKARKFFHG